MQADCNIMIRNVPVEIRREIKIQALKEGKTMQELILDLIKKHIEEARHE